MILGGGPNRIGQGIEFDYCCCHASFALRELGIESIMVNSNPETVSTDYDTSDLLFFEPLTTEDVLNICDRVQPDGVIVQFGGQTPLNLSRALATAGVPIIGTSVDTIEAAEDREKFQQLLERLDLRQPANGIARNMATARMEAKKVGFPGAGAAQFRARRTGHGDLLRPGPVRAVRGGGVCRRARTTRADRPVPGRCHRGGRRRDLRRRGRGRHGRDGTHRGGGGPFGRFRVRDSAVQSAGTGGAGDPRSDTGHGTAPESHRADERAVRRQEGRRPPECLRAGSEPARSRTVPFVAKATGVPVAKIAAQVMTGKTLRELNITAEPIPAHVSVKESVFPFRKFVGVDIVLGPEMRSTGEVMGVSERFSIAFAKSQLAAGVVLPERGKIFLSVSARHKEQSSTWRDD